MTTVSISYKKNEFEEHLVTLYLRLNEYFTSGFIVHSNQIGNIRSEVDILATRFPLSREPEREIGTCQELSVPNDLVDFIIGEVKNKKEIPAFNPSMFDICNIKYQLRWMGVFTDKEVNIVANQLITQLNNKTDGFPCVQWPQHDKNKSETPHYQVRLILFDLYPSHLPDLRCISGRAVIKYIWNCFRADIRPKGCSRQYTYDAWGSLYSPMVRYFKDKRRKKQPESVEEILGQFYECP